MKMIPRSNRAFSLIEALVVLAVMAVLGSVAMVVASRSTEVAESTKLTQDVAALNSAVRVFKANGGKIANSWKSSRILKELKTKADTATGAMIAGLRGSVLDPRVEGIDETYEESASGEPKALWDSVNHRFYISTAPIRGIRRFEMNEALAETETEERARNVTLALSGVNGWVWAFKDQPGTKRDAPRSPDAALVPAGSESGNGSGPLLPGQLALNQPVASGSSGGTYELADFPLSFSVADQNPSGYSVLMVSTNGQDYTVYTGPISVQPGGSIYSYAESQDPSNWVSSPVRIDTFTANRVALQIALVFDKAAYSYGDLGGAFIGGGTPGSGVNRGLISLLNGGMIPSAYMTSDHFRVQWTYDGTSPLIGSPAVGAPFSGTWTNQPVALALGNLAPGAGVMVISAAAKSLAPAALDNSTVQVSTLAVNRIKLREPEVTVPLGKVSLNLVTTFGDMPEGARIFYNTNGVDPGDLYGNPTSGTAYTGGLITIPSGGLVVARTYGPASTANWFSVSESVLVSDDPTDTGLIGGHIDVDTSSFIASINSGSTDGHVHEYDNKYSTIGVDYFSLLDSKLHNINQDISNPNTRFKLIVSNPNLSTGGRLVINSTYSAANPATYQRVGDYAGTSLNDLPIYSLGGVAGTTKLTKLQLYFATNAIVAGGIIPTNTGDVRANKPGRNGEWRNGALTIQAVTVNADGSPAFTTSLPLSAGGVQGVASSGLLWESTVFHHWAGLSYHASTWNPGTSSYIP